MVLKNIKLRVLTPEKTFFSGDVAGVTVKGWEGYLGILYDHSPLVTPLVPGVLTIRTGEDESRKASVAQGLMEVMPEEVTILVDAAEWPGEIDVDRAQRARERAEERLGQQDRDDIDVLRARLSLQRALTRIRVANTLRNG